MMACQLLLVLNYYLLPWEARLVKYGLGWILRLDVMFGLSLLFILFSCCKSLSFLSGSPGALTIYTENPEILDGK